MKRLFEVLSINPAATNCILRYNHVPKYVWSDAIAPLMLVVIHMTGMILIVEMYFIFNRAVKFWYARCPSGVFSFACA